MKNGEKGERLRNLPDSKANLTPSEGETERKLDRRILGSHSLRKAHAM